MTAFIFVFEIAMIIWLVIMSFLNARAIRRAPTPTVQPESYQDPKPICGCEHHHCFHDENGCGHTYNWYDINIWKIVTCGCKRYTGPQPLPTVLPELDFVIPQIEPSHIEQSQAHTWREAIRRYRKVSR